MDSGMMERTTLFELTQGGKRRATPPIQVLDSMTIPRNIVPRHLVQRSMTHSVPSDGQHPQFTEGETRVQQCDLVAAHRLRHGHVSIEEVLHARRGEEAEKGEDVDAEHFERGESLFRCDGWERWEWAVERHQRRRLLFL
jgi:hypothetical protein